MKRRDFVPPDSGALWDFLRQELADRPGRMAWTLRLLGTSLVVVLISMTFEVPLIVLSVAVVVFYGLQPNAVVTRIVAVVFFIGTLLEVGTVLLVIKFTYDYPLVRIVVSSLIFLACMYLMRVHKAGLIFFAIGTVLVYGQTTVDTLDFPELALRAMLWSGVSCLYPIVVVWLFNLFLFPLEEPSQQLSRELHRQLTAVMDRLLCVEEGRQAHEQASLEICDRDAMTLRKLHGLVVMQDKSYRAASVYWSSCMDAVAYLVAMSVDTRPSLSVRAAEEQALLRKLREQVHELRDALAGFVRYQPKRPMSQADMVVAGQMGLGGYCRTLAALADAGARPDAAAAEKKGGAFVPDALTNPVYVQFALKTLLASLVCYVFYHAVQWDGIHTSMITCALVANPNVGASSEKIALRISGALLGGFFALVLSLFVVPHIDTIVGLLITIAPVFFLAGWIAAGPERSSYIGVQMVATFCLGFLGHFGPSTDLVEIRDRTVGILVGAVVSGLVYTLIWPESETGTLRRKLADMIDQLGRLQARPGRDGEAWLDYLRQRMSCVAAMDECRDMRRRVSMEGHLAPAMKQELLTCSELVLVRSRCVAADGDALRGYGTDAFTQKSGPSDEALSVWQDEAGAWLQRYAGGLSAAVEDGGAAFPPRPLAEPEGASVLAAKARHMAGQINGLPQWFSSSGARP